MLRLAQIGIAAAALVGAGCGGDESGSTGGFTSVASSSTSTEGKTRLAMQTGPPGTGTTIKTLSSQFGKVLFSKGNRAIYYFDKESGRTPKCYGSCAQAWPPVLTQEAPRASGQARAGLLGRTTRNNGKKQVTYNGHPLYFYVSDPEGEVECHNIEEFGGLWLAVKPNGDPVS